MAVRSESRSGTCPPALLPPLLSRCCMRCCARRATWPAKPRSASTVSAGLLPAPGGLETGSKALSLCWTGAEGPGATLQPLALLLAAFCCKDGLLPPSALHDARVPAEWSSAAAALGGAVTAPSRRRQRRHGMHKAHAAAAPREHGLTSVLAVRLRPCSSALAWFLCVSSEKGSAGLVRGTAAASAVDAAAATAECSAAQLASPALPRHS